MLCNIFYIVKYVLYTCTHLHRYAPHIWTYLSITFFHLNLLFSLLSVMPPTLVGHPEGSLWWAHLICGSVMPPALVGHPEGPLRWAHLICGRGKFYFFLSYCNMKPNFKFTYCKYKSKRANVYNQTEKANHEPSKDASDHPVSPSVKVIICYY